MSRAGTLKLTAGGSTGDMPFESSFSWASDPTGTVPFDTYGR